MASMLLDDHTESNCEDCRGLKLLYEAVRRNYAFVVRLLVQAEFKLV